MEPLTAISGICGLVSFFLLFYIIKSTKQEHRIKELESYIVDWRNRRDELLKERRELTTQVHELKKQLAEKDNLIEEFHQFVDDIRENVNLMPTRDT